MSTADGSSGPQGTEPIKEFILRSDERARIGRDLHDSTSQLLVLMQLKLGELRRSGSPDARAIVEECEQVIRDLREQIRRLAAP